MYLVLAVLARHAYLVVSKKLIQLFLAPLQVPLLDKQKAFGKDLNLVFWTDNQRKINPDLIEGKCYLRSQQSIQNSNETVESWTKAGEYRFYFNQYYNKEAKEITGDLPYKAENYGATVSKGKGGKGKGNMCILGFDFTVIYEILRFECDLT